MKLKDFYSTGDDQLAVDTLLREAVEEQWVKEAHGERAARQSSQAKKDYRRGPGGVIKPENPPEPDEDDFGDEPEDFGDKTVATSFGGEDVEQPEEFRGAPADPAMSGFEDKPDGSEFDGEPVFGDVPEPIVDPDASLWHGNIGWNDDETGSSSSSHRTSVSFPDYEGPKHRSSYHPEDKPDEKGFYPRASSKPKKSRR